LLRRADGEAVAGHGAAELPERVRGDVSRTCLGNAVELEKAADDLRAARHRVPGGFGPFD